MPHTYFFFLFSFFLSFSFLFRFARENFPHAQVGTFSTFYIIPYLLSPDFVSQLRYLPTLHAVSFCFIVSRERERAREGERRITASPSLVAPLIFYLSITVVSSPTFELYRSNAHAKTQTHNPPLAAPPSWW